MKTTEKKRFNAKRFNALDVAIVLTVLLAVVAFFMRGRLEALFAEEADRVITYSYAVTDVEEETAAYLRAGSVLYTASGQEIGEVLTVTSADAADTEMLSDGRTVEVKNGLFDLSGTVTANGYEAQGFVYLECGQILVPGQTVTVTTGDAVFVLQITQVQIADAPET